MSRFTFGRELRGVIVSALKKIEWYYNNLCSFLVSSLEDYNESIDHSDDAITYIIPDGIPNQDDMFVSDFSAVYYGDTEVESLTKNGLLRYKKTSPVPPIDWDETKIAIALLDENDQITGVHYEETIHDARAYLNSNLDKRYYVRIGDYCGVSYLPRKVNSESEQNTETFYNCTNMVFLHLGECVEGFGSSSETGYRSFGALQYCTALKAYTFAASEFNYMADGTFAYCSSLVSATIPNGITEILAGSFLENSALHRIVLPNGVTTIRNGAAQFLNNCEIIIPSSISTIEPAAFWKSDSITIRIDKPRDSIPNSPWGATNATVIWEG